MHVCVCLWHCCAACLLCRTVAQAQGRAKLGVEAFAEALLGFVKILAENSGWVLMEGGVWVGTVAAHAGWHLARQLQRQVVSCLADSRRPSFQRHRFLGTHMLETPHTCYAWCLMPTCVYVV